MIILIAILDSTIIEKITFPAKEFIGYAKEFEQINFKEIENEMTNLDFIKLAHAFNELQNKLFETINETQKKNNEIILLNEKMKQDFIYKRNLVSSISHDIKTPLTIIEATIHGIKDQIFTQEEIPNELENVLKEIDKTKKMLQDTINIYKIDADLADKSLYSDFNLIELVNEVTADFKKLIEKYQHKLSLNIQTDVKIHANKVQFKKALSNLLLNAIVYSPVDSTIYINILNIGKQKTLEIINTGVTIPNDDIIHIFKPFYRIDKSRTSGEDYGNGLGLYITSEILKKHNLEINVTNLENAVKFYINF
jgi:two-component system sensor histidine kinase VanS